MEIERKFLVKELPENLQQYPHDELCQAYVCTAPVIRVRQKNDTYILTIKSGGMLAREEIEMPIDATAFEHLKAKKDGMLISKTRYKIPEEHGYTIELDLFHDVYEGFHMAEVEFESEEAANNYTPPAWFGEDVTFDPRFHNSRLCKNTVQEVAAFLSYVLSV
ncbi:MAG: CYTH domain-containing protein [Eubacteriales bacterium]|nr:CYTH domain-containing protein [Eubacteriales bacterium]